MKLHIYSTRFHLDRFLFKNINVIIFEIITNNYWHYMRPSFIHIFRAQNLTNNTRIIISIKITNIIDTQLERC